MIKLKHLISENKRDIIKYQAEFAAYLKGMKPRIAGFRWTEERMTGSWEWYNPRINIVVYATWGWEGKEQVPIEIEDGDVVKTLKYKHTGDLKKDATWYLSNMKRYLPGIAKDYK